MKARDILFSWLALSEALFFPSLLQPTSSLHRGTIFSGTALPSPSLLGPQQGKTFSDNDPEILKNEIASPQVKFTRKNALFVSVV